MRVFGLRNIHEPHAAVATRRRQSPTNVTPTWFASRAKMAAVQEIITRIIMHAAL